MIPPEIFPVRSKLTALGVSRLGVFGSYARGEASAESDVDLLVSFLPEKKSYDALCETAEILELALGRKVDLVTTESLSPHIGPHVLSEVQYVDLGN